MRDDSRFTSRAALLFAAVGLILGALIGLTAIHSWLGIGILAVVVLLMIGLYLDVDIITDLAMAILDPVMNMIARAGENWAGTDPGKPVHAGLRVIFGATFLAGAFAVVMIEFSATAGAA